MNKFKVALIALVITIIVTIPEFPLIIDYIKSPKELGEMVLAIVVRFILWYILLKIAIFVYEVIKKLSRKRKTKSKVH